MGVTYRVEKTMPAPADRIWPYLADLTKYGDWMGGMSAERIDGASDPLAVGTTFRYAVMDGSRELRGVMQVTDLEPERRISMKTIESDAFAWEGTFALEPAEYGSTRVTSSGTYRFRGLRRLMEPLMRGELAKREQAELEKIFELVTAPEAASAASDAPIANEPDAAQ